MPNLFDDFDLDVKKVLKSSEKINPRYCEPSGDGETMGFCSSTCSITDNTTSPCVTASLALC